MSDDAALVGELFSCGMSSPSTLMGVGLGVLRVMTSIFLRLMLSPTWCAYVLSRLVFSCMCLWVWERSLISSTWSILSRVEERVHLVPLGWSSVVHRITQSMAILKRNAEITHPCRTPVLTSKLMWDTIGSKDAPKAISVDAIKGLLEVHKVDVQFSLPFHALLYYVAYGEIWSTHPLFLWNLACSFLSCSSTVWEMRWMMILMSLVWDGQDSNTMPIITVAQSTFLGDPNDYPLSPVIWYLFPFPHCTKAVGSLLRAQGWP